MLCKLLALSLVANSAAFSNPAALGLRCPAVAHRTLRPTSASRARKVFVSPVSLEVKDDKPTDDEDKKIVFNANEGWQADHQKPVASMHAGGHQQLKMKDQGYNQDTPDYFETADGQIVETTNALDGNINTRGMIEEDISSKGTDKDSGGMGKLGELLSTKDTMVKEFDRQTYTTTLTRMGGFKAHKWKVDGDWNTEPETFDLKFNTVAATGTKIFLQPSAMTFEDFLAGWTDDSAPGFKIEPEKGTMDRRGGEETEFTVVYSGPQPTEELFATLVVLLPNDNFQWTFKFRLSPP